MCGCIPEIYSTLNMLLLQYPEHGITDTIDIVKIKLSAMPGSENATIRQSE